jgi:hypothetical protein
MRRTGVTTPARSMLIEATLSALMWIAHSRQSSSTVFARQG